MLIRVKNSGTSRGRGFSLLELIVTAAIFCILCIIGVSGYQSANVRTRNSRVHVDLRTISVGLDMYSSDNNSYPPAEHAAVAPVGRYVAHLTTPIAYCVGEAAFRDQYPYRHIGAMGYAEEPTPTFAYDAFDKLPAGVTAENDPVYASTNRVNKNLYGSYLLMSGGPQSDRLACSTMLLPDVHGAIMIPVQYDATNGVASAGHLLRSQKGSGQPVTDRFDRGRQSS